MATYTTNNGTNLNILDNGVYKIAGDPTNVVIRSGNNLYRTTTKTLSEGGISPSYTGTISGETLANSESTFQRTPGLSLGLYGNLQDFYSSAIGTPGGTSFTASVAPNNPNAGVVTDSTGRVLTGPAPAPQAGALTPTAANSVNPNAIGINGQQTPIGQTPSNNTPTALLGSAQSANQGPTPITTDPSGIVPGGKLIGPTPYSAPSSVNSGNTYGTSNTTYTYPTNSNTGTSVLGGATAAAAAQSVKDAESAKLGPQDTLISDMIKSTLDLNNQEAGKAAYQQQQNDAQGVVEKQNTVNDLQAQLQGILNEHAAAQLAVQQGQGVTTAIDDRQRAEETRQNAIKVLSINSLIAAANSNLANAQALANKAVALKFDPIEASIKANIDNINLIKADPKTTAEEKARADTISAALDAQKAALDVAKTQATAVQNVAVDAASNINTFVPTSQFQTASQALQAIQSAPDPVTAQSIATQTGLTKVTTAVKEVNGRQVLYNTQTGATIKDLGSAISTTDAQKTAAIANAQATLTKAVGSDGYTDPNLYARTRAGSTLSASEFDNKFGYLVNPASLARLGISSASTVTGTGLTADQLKQQINQQISQIPSSASTSDIQAYIRSLGGNPADFGYP